MPNFRIMEIDIDDVPWQDDLVTDRRSIENGELIVPTRPGWGVEVNEAAVRAHPPGQAPGQASPGPSAPAQAGTR